MNVLQFLSKSPLVAERHVLRMSCGAGVEPEPCLSVGVRGLRSCRYTSSHTHMHGNIHFISIRNKTFQYQHSVHCIHTLPTYIHTYIHTYVTLKHINFCSFHDVPLFYIPARNISLHTFT